MISKCTRGCLGLVAFSLWFSVTTAPLFGQGQQGARPVPRMPATMLPRPNEPVTIKMRLEGQDLVAEIRNAPLQQVLEELAAWTGVVFEIESQENPPVSISFFKVSLEEAIQRLTGHNNAIMYYERDEAGQNHVRFVRVFARAARPQAPTLHYLGTGAITKRSDDIVDSPEQALAVLAGSTNLLARQKAVEFLVTTKGTAAIQALKVAVSDAALEIKVAAIEGLVTLGLRDAVPQIIPALKDANPGVRKSAVQAVGLLGDFANVKDLRPLLRDQDSSVAAAAEIAIQKLSVRRP